ncbi:MAG: hypothetical protein JWN08_1775 [Frankiales bacterium]|jgi:hypothetical protein|nr:hypothetical protein [Frankiales bacterium]
MTLDDLTTDELRERALAKAEKAHDLGFVWELVKHMRGSAAIAGEDGSSGGITGSISELVHVVRELRGKEPLGVDEPLLRARFLEYLKA